jgi:hypothetical protein
MKYRLTSKALCMLGCCLAATVLSSNFSTAEETATVASGRSIALVTVGQPLEKNVVEGVSRWLHENLFTPIRLKPHQTAVGDTPEAEAAQIQNLLTTNDICILALINIPEKVQFLQGAFQSKSVALLNVQSLKPSKMETPEDQSRYLWRIKKESIAAVAQELGLGVCPYSRCALSKWDTEAQLDAKGRYLCPPCTGRCMNILEARGIHTGTR